MASQNQKLHFVLFPMMAQGHMIPMMDIAKILAQHNNVVTIVTTPQNASRYTSTIARYIEYGFHIQLIELKFPCKEFGLPEGCENLDMLPSLGIASDFFNASRLLKQEALKLIEELSPPPSCIISDMCLPYTIHIARKFNIPRISFIGTSCLYVLAMYNIHANNMMQIMANKENEYFDLPGTSEKIEITIAQTGLGLKSTEAWNQFNIDLGDAEMGSYGIIVNSFEELEPSFVKEYKKVNNDKVWCIGPVSLSNTDYLDKGQRGNNNKVSSGEWKHMKWLDSQKQGSLIYASLGSLCNITPTQMIELGLALEATKRPFIWVIRDGNQLEALEKWVEESGFEGRINGIGLVIKGWAPQLLILSHPSIGGFLTHCGWNSTIEAICAGVPMVTWPLFADQFLNETLAVQILKVGVKIGVETPLKWGEEEESSVLVKKEDIIRGIERLMDESSESEEIRKNIKELANMAKKAVEKDGSSYSNVTLFIQDIIQKNKDMSKGIGTEELKEFEKKVYDVEIKSNGAILNTCEELEKEYVKDYKMVRNDEVFSVAKESC